MGVAASLEMRWPAWPAFFAHVGLYGGFCKVEVVRWGRKCEGSYDWFHIP